MDSGITTFDRILSTLHNLFDVADNALKPVDTPTTKYVRDAKAMAATPVDVKELRTSYVFVVDMPGMKAGNVRVQVEDGNVLVISGERKREEEGGAKYLKMERRVGRFMRWFVLPENANVESISAAARDGVLTVTVEKLPPPEPKNPKTIQVQIA
ncbi:hypothetical protein U1Q18_026856 [Sarracenia purpurea var. burkii]